MIQWIYSKRNYLWGMCLLAAATFLGVIHFAKDWVNSPGNDVSIIFLTSLWIVSVLTFYFNAIAHTIYGKKACNHSKIVKGLIISFFSFVSIVGCSLALWVMISLTIQR